MSGILYLTKEDFFIGKGIKGPLLYTSIKGFSLLLFYSDNCKHSRNVLPIFKRLPSCISNCVFGMCNIDKNRTAIELSKKTIAPINYVPYIVLCIDGKPHICYKGPPELDDIKRFIFDVSVNYSKRISAMSQGSNPTKAGLATSRGSLYEDKNHGIPVFSLGVPLYGDDNVTYLIFNDKGEYQHSKDEKLNSKTIYRKETFDYNNLNRR